MSGRSARAAAFALLAAVLRRKLAAVSPPDTDDDADWSAGLDRLVAELTDVDVEPSAAALADVRALRKAVHALRLREATARTATSHVLHTLAEQKATIRALRSTLSAVRSICRSDPGAVARWVTRTATPDARVESEGDIAALQRRVLDVLGPAREPAAAVRLQPVWDSIGMRDVSGLPPDLTPSGRQPDRCWRVEGAHSPVGGFIPADLMIGWFCCQCGAERDGVPAGSDGA